SSPPSRSPPRQGSASRPKARAGTLVDLFVTTLLLERGRGVPDRAQVPAVRGESHPQADDRSCARSVGDGSSWNAVSTELQGQERLAVLESRTQNGTSGARSREVCHR